MPLSTVLDGIQKVAPDIDGSIEITVPTEAFAFFAVTAANASLWNLLFNRLAIFARLCTGSLAVLIVCGFPVTTTAQFGGVVLLHIHSCILLRQSLVQSSCRRRW